MWPSATNWGVSKLRKVLHRNKHYLVHTLMQKWFQWIEFTKYSAIFLSSKVTKSWTLACRVSSKLALQRYGLSKIVIYVYFCRPIKNKMSHNTSFLPQFHWKSVCHDWVWYDEYLERIYQKWKILTLAHIFAYINSKSMLPQRASFSCAGIRIFLI